MIALSSGRSTVPQIFFNDMHVGGADDLARLLRDSEKDDWAVKVLQAPDPSDPRLAPSSDHPNSKTHEQRSELPLHPISLPDGRLMSVLELLPLLERILHPHHRPYKAHWYKNCFVNSDAVLAVQKEFDIDSAAATQFLRKLQHDYDLLHHVCGNHVFRGDGYYFFRLSCHHEPHILNSSIEWKRLATTSDFSTMDPIDIVYELQGQLQRILPKYTNHDGLTDFVHVAQDSEFWAYEISSCVLQGRSIFLVAMINGIYLIDSCYRICQHLIISPIPCFFFVVELVKKSTCPSWRKRLARPIA
jgi:hypothetical protein